MADNPVVAVAKKLIPASYSEKIGGWIKAHRRTVFMSVGLVASLYAYYLQHKMGVRRAQSRFEATVEATQNKQYEVLRGLNRVSDKAAMISRGVSNRAGIVESALSDQEKRIATVERALTNKDFLSWLEKNGYSDVRRVRK